ncbi:hypothetical protein [Cohnella algarum]|uniref:hypothetical protein n=1 Tax=Cohnella algarum TaxID=2044859 RepID=UPI001967C9E7|nr:hypothetical protein [Cohnella algarum]MBN2984292.1 hypothetical protein [Cohnella algarum]
MNLADMLTYADIEQLTRIAETYGCETSSHSKHELIQSILSTVQRREAIAQRVDGMSEEDLRLLNSLLFEPRELYSLEDLTARALWTASDTNARASVPAAEPAAVKTAPAPKGRASKSGSGRRKGKAASEAPPVPDHSARQAIARFKRFGWLFNGFTQHTRYMLQVPEDVKSRLADVLDERFRNRLDVREEPGVYRDERNLLCEDAVLFLRYVRDHDILLTSEGYLYKRQLGQLLESLSVTEALPGKTAWRFGYGRRFREYPERFSLLYDFCCQENWVRESGERLELTEAGLLAAGGGRPIEPAEMYRFWLRSYRGPIPNVLPLAQWTMRLAADWTTTASLASVLLPLVRPYYYDTAEDVLHLRILKMMMHLGLLRWGETNDGVPLVRLTPIGKSAMKEKV